MSNFIEYIKGDIINGIVYIWEEGKRKNNHRICTFQCPICWNMMEKEVVLIKKGAIKSCWCINSKHWFSKTKIYWIYMWILQRCNNQKAINYIFYWARWIKSEWKWFNDFYSEVWKYYKEGLTIDRIDNNWNYSKENCRWITLKENNRNKRNNRIYTYKGKTQCISAWREEYHIYRGALEWRLDRGWSFKRAIETPIKRSHLRGVKIKNLITLH